MLPPNIFEREGSSNLPTVLHKPRGKGVESPVGFGAR